MTFHYNGEFNSHVARIIAARLYQMNFGEREVTVYANSETIRQFRESGGYRPYGGVFRVGGEDLGSGRGWTIHQDMSIAGYRLTEDNLIDTGELFVRDDSNGDFIMHITNRPEPSKLYPERRIKD